MKSQDNPFSVNNADDSSGFLLWRVTSLWQRGIVTVLEEYRLTHSQFVLMASIHWLTLHNKEVTQIALSSHTKIDPMTTSTVLRTLQKKGLIQRKEHSTDTRAKTVTLTESGEKIAREAVISVMRYDVNFFSVLDKKTAEFNAQLVTLMTCNTTTSKGKHPDQENRSSI